jgi:predicted PurR-regulated permease PerM
MESKKKERIDYKSVNKLVVLSKRTIKIIYYIMILLLIVLISELFRRWHIFSIIVDILTVILPLFIGFIIAWLLNPLIKKLSKKIPKIGAVIVVYLVILAIIGGVVALIIPNLASEIKDLANQIPSTINDIEKFITNAGNKLSSLGINGDDTKKEIFTALTKLGGTVSNNLATYILNTGKGIINVVAVIALSIIIAVYLSIDFDKIRGRVKKMLPKKWQKNYMDLTERFDNTLRKYVTGVLLIMFLVFITQSIGFALAGLPAPLIFALFCAITDVIPYFGPYIGGIPAVIVAFTISPVVGIWTIVAILIVQNLENNFYQPLIMGHAMELHPVTIIVGLLLFGHYFGLVGMIFATPIMACIKILVEFIKEKGTIQDFIEEQKIVNKDLKI